MKRQIISIITLSALSVAVIGLSIYSLVTHRNLEDLRMDEAAAREEVFAGLVSSAEKLNAGFMKLSVSGDTAKMEELLADVWRDSAEAAAQIDNAALDEEDKRELEAFVNTVGDYAHELGNKLAENRTISAEDRQQLTEIADVLEMVTEQLQYARINGYTADIDIDDFFEEREQEFISGEYPRLIYDGPFSESIQNRAPRGLPGYNVTEQKALKVAEDFVHHVLAPTAHTDGEVLPFYNFENADGSVRVSVTKQGGAILYYKKEIETDGLSVLPSEKRLREIEEIAGKYLEEKGYGKTVPSWKSYYNGMAVIEMVPATADGIRLYPDLIKVWVNLQSGEVTALDTRNYLMNHRLRDLPREILSREAAEERLSEELTVLERSLAVIPNDDGSESFCYGFLCIKDKQKLIVFLDAVNGSERDILVVMERGDGQLTM
ncbi:MAG: germination protein YpeB [Christensenellaceae bacterium]|nr:germination protein YpeB [Christensenellaceae bacterium]